jgi:hypothetical protein
MNLLATRIYLPLTLDESLPAKCVEPRRSPTETSRSIARLRKCFCRQGDPIISVDAKKRELVGNFKNAGVKWERVSW